jgi:mannose-6-phosphate isomerase-like protein (cupin superfamily)
MYKLIYIEHGVKHEVTSSTSEPLQMIVRHMFAIHNNYKGSVEDFELVYFGEEK